MKQRLTYRFGPLERRGLLGPVRPGQAAVIAAGVAAAVAALDLSPRGPGVLAAAACLAAGVFAGTVPFGHRTSSEWTGVIAAYAWRRRRRRFRSPIPTHGFRLRAGARIAEPELALPPGVARDVEIVTVGREGSTIGALSEQGARRLTAVLACRVNTFSLLDGEGQERRLHRWGLVLSGCAGTAVRRLGWLERTAPGQADTLARWFHDERAPDTPLRGSPIVDSYLELIAGSAPLTQQHEILMTVQVEAGRVRDRGVEAVGRALVEEAGRVAQALEAAEVTVLGALTAPQIARAVRVAFDPFARAELAARDAPAPDGESTTGAWPLAADEAWDTYRSDGALHSTYWIAGWPRVDVSPLFMDALLGRSSAVRTVAVTFEPVPGERSTRDVEAAVTRDRADRELRHRFGQSETARHRLAQESTARREAELAAGHGEVRFAGFVTVSGRDREELRRARAEVIDHAARARLELRCMYGQQADAFTFTLPLCRGLR